MNPEFGSGLWNILFENITDDLNPIIESTIRKDIGRWMSYISVQSVNVEQSQVNQNQVDVEVTYTVPSAGVNDAQTIQVAMNTSNTP